MVDVGEVTLHVACQGQGPTIILLHGFPEFWYGWNPILEALAQHFRVIMPDQRGYNLSSKPQDVDAYRVSRLAADIEALINVVSPEGVAAVVGHDWGGALLEGNLVGLEDYASDVSIERLPDAGHWVVHDTPNEVTSAIINFVLRGQQMSCFATHENITIKTPPENSRNFWKRHPLSCSIPRS